MKFVRFFTKVLIENTRNLSLINHLLSQNVQYYMLFNYKEVTWLLFASCVAWLIYNDIPEGHDYHCEKIISTLMSVNIGRRYLRWRQTLLIAANVCREYFIANCDILGLLAATLMLVRNYVSKRVSIKLQH